MTTSRLDLRMGILRVPRLDVTALMSQVSTEGRAVFVLPFQGIANRDAFTAAAIARLPLDPPWHGGSWDAFSNSLREGLYQHPSRQLVLLWPGAYSMFLRDFATYDVVTGVFADVASTLADPQATDGKPKDLCVVLESSDRDGDEERARKRRLFEQFLDLDCPAPDREKLRVDVASCAAGGLPIVRPFSFNVFDLTLDARVGGAELVETISPGEAALFTFDELALLLAG